MSNSMIDCRFCVREIDLENGIRSTISGFAEFASESSKGGRSRSGVSLVADIKCTVRPWDVLHSRINGLIRKRR